MWAEQTSQLHRNGQDSKTADIEPIRTKSIQPRVTYTDACSTESNRRENLRSPAGITPLGCGHTAGRPLLPLWHLITFGTALALLMDVGTSVMWQLVPFAWHPSDVVSAHADGLMLLSYRALHLPRHRKCRCLVITVTWAGSGTCRSMLKVLGKVLRGCRRRLVTAKLVTQVWDITQHRQVPCFS